jgi:DNA-binding NarL/FixJ family response regulator
VNILVVDDHALFREGVVSLLSAYPDFKIVGEAGSGSEAEEKALRLNPDIILMDIGLPDKTGLETTRCILARQPDIKVVMLTVHESDEYLFSALSAGAIGYLPKSVTANQIVASLKAIGMEEAALSRIMIPRLIKEFKRLSSNNHDDSSNELDILSPRELEVFWKLVDGASNLEIAETLIIAESTVKAHVSSILTKLNLNNRYDAARYVRQHQIPHQDE